MTTRSASASVEVSVDPPTAFRAFTEEIDRWWVPGPINAWDFSRAVSRRIEPGVGGRVLEVYEGDGADGSSSAGSRCGSRVAGWSTAAAWTTPRWTSGSSRSVAGTRVSVEHYVLPGGDAERAGLFWPNVIHWLVPWCRDRDAARPPRTLGPAGRRPALPDPAAAARWLAAVFGLRSWDRIPAEEQQPQWIEMHVGNAAVLLFAAEGKWSPEPVSHDVWVYVDDLDAHFTRGERRRRDDRRRHRAARVPRVRRRGSRGAPLDVRPGVAGHARHMT